jgi:hypothetical protein
LHEPHQQPACHAHLRTPPAPFTAPQRLDYACTAIAEANLALQLLGVVWRMLGQLVAVESLVFVILRPKLLQHLHALLASGAVTLSAALHRLGLIRSELLPGELFAR